MSPVTTKRRFSQESPLGEGAPGDPLHTARLRGFAVGLWSGRGLGHDTAAPSWYGPHLEVLEGFTAVLGTGTGRGELRMPPPRMLCRDHISVRLR